MLGRLLCKLGLHRWIYHCTDEWTFLLWRECKRPCCEAHGWHKRQDRDQLEDIWG